MTGPSAAVDSSSGRSRNSRRSCFAPAPGSDKHTRITPARSSRAPAPGDIPTVVLTSTRLADKPRHHPPPHHGDPARHPDRRHQIPQKHDQRRPTSCLARPEKRLVTGHASSFGTVQPPRHMIKSGTANLQVKPKILYSSPTGSPRIRTSSPGGQSWTGGANSGRPRDVTTAHCCAAPRWPRRRNDCHHGPRTSRCRRETSSAAAKPGNAVRFAAGAS
jgi:hypothetical protein